MSIFGQNNNTGGSQPSNNIFGNAQGSGGASNNVFGGGLNTGAKPATGGGLFGSTPSIFGSGNTSAPASGGGLFGGGASGNTATTSAGGGGLFGGGAPAAPATAPSNPNPLFGGGAAATNTSSAPTSAPLFGGGSTTTGTGGGLFGGSGASTSTNTNPLFGGQPSSTAPASGGLFGPPKTDQNASKPAQSNFFSNPSTSSAPATGSAPAPIGGLFGSTAPKPADASTPAAPAAAPSGGLFGGGGLFGKKPEAPAAGAGTTPAATLNPLFGNKDAGASSTAPPAAPSGGLFGGGLGAKPTENAGAAPAPTGGLFGPAKDTSAEKKDAAPGPAFNLFGAAKPATTTTEKKDAPAASGSALGSFSLGGAKEAEKPKDGAAPAATLAPVAVPPPSMLRGKTIEEIVNRWSSDLEIHVKEFNRFASEVAVWDRALIENGNNLAALYSHVLTAEREQNDIDQSLDHIEQQQRDLSATLDAYEKTTDEVLGGQGGSLRALDTGPADTERDKNYMLATDLHTHLDDLSGSLTQMIESVNALSLGPGPGENKSQGDDPMAQIAAILSSHLESLQWIDGAVREVESKVTDVERRVNLSGGGGGKSRGFGLNR
ncbi:hypothetical protein PLICRDRAFT_169358 [Plicaturopsis crispa FD-325 SS-3]|nr:hypothetical protein PLICRDRAFT_169358 [Plicaturopsis crispa FD-325 SS-3]